MKSHKPAALLAFVVLSLAVPTLLGNGIHAKQPPLSRVAKAPAGGFTVHVLSEGQWREAGKLAFNQYPQERRLDLSPFLSGKDVEKVRLVQSGGESSHVDAVTLGGIAPSAVTGTHDPLAVKKLLTRDSDVLDAIGRTLELEFAADAPDKTLRLTARVEPPSVRETPFQFPIKNLFKPVDERADFFSYTLLQPQTASSSSGQASFRRKPESRASKTSGKPPRSSKKKTNVASLSEQSQEKSGARELKMPSEPLFKEYCRTGSGHPDGFTYGWLTNDETNLYVKLEFTPDNTLGGEKDYATIWAQTGTGLKAFKVSHSAGQYGKSEFTYTDKVPYQHKVYDFRIPLAELGIDKLRKGMELRLAFSAYGSAGPNDPGAGSSPGDPYIKFSLVRALNDAYGGRTVLTLRVFDPDGTVPADIDTIEVTGPLGFSCSISDAEFIGNNQYWLDLSGLPAEGEYVFRVTDLDGNWATSTYYHHMGSLMPLADTSSFLVTGSAAAPTLSWGSINGYEGNLFYQANIYEKSTGNFVWGSSYVANTSVTVPSGRLSPSTAYQWRVDVFDSFRNEVSDYRSTSALVDFPVASGTPPNQLYQATRPYFVNAYVTNRYRPDDFGSYGHYTYAYVSVKDPDGALPGSIGSIKVERLLPNDQAEHICTLAVDDYYAEGQDYSRSILGAPLDGVYRFTAEDVNGNQAFTYDYLKSKDVPAVDIDTMEASGSPYDSANPTLTLSWGAPDGITGALYYLASIYVTDQGVETTLWSSSITSETMVVVPISASQGAAVPPLDEGKSYRWRVRALDSKYSTHGNRSDSPFRALSRDQVTVGNSKPFFRSASVYRSRYPYADYTVFDVYVADPGGRAPDTIGSVTVSDPNGATYQFRREDIIRDPTSTVATEWWYGGDPQTLPAGVYTITATNSQGSTAVTHEYLGAPPFIGTLNENRFRVYPLNDPLTPSNNPVVSWDGVDGYDGHLYYRLRVRDGDGINVFSSSRDPVGAISVPNSSLPRDLLCTSPRRPYLFRVEAQEDPDWVLFDTRSVSNWMPLYPQLDLASLGVAPGGSIRVPIVLRNAPGIHVASTTNQVVFDANLLQLQFDQGLPKVEKGEADGMTGKLISSSYSLNGSMGSLSVSIGGNNDRIAGGTVAYVHFNVMATSFQGPTTLENCPAATDADGNSVYTAGDWAEITILPVTSTYDPIPGPTLEFPDPGNPAISTLQEALDAVPATGTVLVEPGIYPCDRLTFAKQVRLVCNGEQGSCILDGGGVRPVLRLTSEDGPTSEAIKASVIWGFTIQNGLGENGGAIYLNNASPTFESCTIINNTASSRGGAIHCYNASPVFRGCTVASNKGGDGGAIFSDGSSPTFIRCYLLKNRATADNGRGGAVYTLNAGTPVFENCLIVSNRAGVTGGTGGAIHAESGSPRVINCTLSGNQALGANARGGAVANGGGALITLVNSILWGDLQNGAPNEVDGAADISFSDVQGGHAGTGNVSVAPLFMDPLNGHYELKPESSCVDRGNGGVAGIGSFDLYGNPRVVGTAVDQGAFETTEGEVHCFDDPDGDGYGSGTDHGAANTLPCPVGQAPNINDCNDGNGAIHPGAAEACDGIDNNCDGWTDEGCSILTWYRDADGDGYGDPNSWVTGADPAPPPGYVDNDQDPDDTDSTFVPGMVIPLPERDALIALYNSTNGPGWYDSTNWVGPVGTECTWVGVGCDANRVAWLTLSMNNLTGSIPPEIGAFRSLQTLDLGENQLSGPIPSEIGSLTTLTDLYLYVNQLSGSIPPQIVNLVNLLTLDLGNNQLSGPIPPEIGSLTALTFVTLRGNQLMGSIPPQIGSLLYNLEVLDLSMNRLTGSIPPEISGLSMLSELHLNENQLSGSIPPEIGNLIGLGSLNLSVNFLTGSIPPQIGNLTGLAWLGLDSNLLSGSLPPQMGQLTGLMWLYLADNRLSSPIPSQLADVTGLYNNESDFRWNGLHTSDDALRTFLISKQYGGDWESTQDLLGNVVTTADFAAGGLHSLSVRSDGSLWVWGTNGVGQLGIGDTTDRSSPVQVGNGTDWMDVSGGAAHSLALQSDGSLWAWGWNEYGQLGLGNRIGRSSPVRVGSDADWMMVSAGDGHSLGIKTNGTLWAWGSSAYGQLGDGSPPPAADRLAPVMIGLDSDWTVVAAGQEHSVGVKSDGTLWAWGRNDHGQLGLGDLADRFAPELVGSDTNWMTVSTRGKHCLALKWDGTLWAWGANDHGQLGLGDTMDRDVPVQIVQSGTVPMAHVNREWIAISAGSHHSLALKSDGKLWSWGRNNSGQLGTRDGVDHLTPFLVPGFSYWIGIAAGESHSLGLQTDGSFRAWGLNTGGQLGLADLNNRQTPSSIPISQPLVYYLDADGDGYGDPGSSTVAFSQPDGYVGNSRDPDDGNPLDKPAAMAPYVRSCNVMAQNTPAGIFSGISVYVFDPGGSVPGSIASLEIRGPNGFAYTASAQNYWRNNEYWIEITETTPAEGEYTFEVVDDEGLRATSTCFHHAGPIIPLPDKQTFLATGNALTPTLSWAAISGYEGNLFYRVRLYDGPDEGFGIWTSGFSPNTFVNVPSSANLQQGHPYLWRVEAFDNYRYEVSDHRVHSGKIDLTVGSGIRPFFMNAYVLNRYRTDATGNFDYFTFPVVVLRDPDGALPGSIQSITVERLLANDQAELLCTLTAADYDPAGGGSYYRTIQGRPADGIYRFTAEDVDGNQAVTYDYVKSNDVPAVADSTMQASGSPYDQANPTLTLSWGAPDGMNRPLYYDVNLFVTEPGGPEVMLWQSSLTSETMVVVPISAAQGATVRPLVNTNVYRWKVRAFDDRNSTHWNRSDSRLKELSQATVDTGNARPYFRGAPVFRSRYNDGDWTALDVYLVDPAGDARETIEWVRVEGPNSFLHEFQQEDLLWGGMTGYLNEWWFRAPHDIDPGVYTITAKKKGQADIVVSHDYLGPDRDIPLPDESRIQVVPSGNPSGSWTATVSWAGIPGFQDHLFYRLRVRDSEGNTLYSAGRDPVTAVTIPSNTLPPQPSCTVEPTAPVESYYLRVEAYDHPDWVVYDTRTVSRWLLLHPKLDLASAGATSGSAVTVPVTLRNAPGIHVSSTANEIFFDPALLDYVSVVSGEAATGAGKTADVVPVGAGRIRVVVSGNTNVLENGVVAHLLFHVKEGTDFIGDISLKNCPSVTTSAGDPAYTGGTWGSIIVTPPPPWGSCPTPAGTLLRVPDVFPTIQGALDAAQGGETVLVEPGSYPVGLLTFNGRSINLTCDGAPGSCILDGQGRNRVFRLVSGDGDGSAICGFTIQNGYSDYGGAIFLDNASPTFETCTITGNTATTGGGAIHCKNSSPTFRTCAITDNQALNGGAIFLDGSSAAFSRCAIFSNKATSGTGHGGAVYTVNAGTSTFVNCLIGGNRAGVSAGAGGSGGAIHAESGSLRLTNCTLTDNRAYGASAHGGAVSVDAAAVSITNSILWDNLQNGFPNGIDGTAAVTFSDDQGGYPGTGNLNSDPLFVNFANGHVELQSGSPCIDKGNSTPSGGVGTHDFYGNQRVSGAAVDMGAFEIIGHCYMDGDGDGYGAGASQSDAWSCPSGQAPNNFDCNDGNAGIHPGATEVCDGIDNNCSGQADEGCVTWYRDADGDGYGDPGDSVVAIEQPPGYVANDTDSDDTDGNIHPGTVWYKDVDNDQYSDGMTESSGTRPAGYKLPSELDSVSGDCNDSDARVHPGAIAIVNGVDYDCNGSVDTIQGAIDLVSSGQTVVVATGAHLVNSLDFGGKNIDLVCVGAPGSCILDGGATSSVLSLHAGETNAALISGFTIRNGNAPNGGGLYLDNASPTVEDCVITSNTAGASGGGIYAHNGSQPTVRRCSITLNNATVEGGGVFTNSGGTFTNCLLTGNTVTSYEGGAIFSNATAVVITNCTIVGNSAGTAGGALCDYAGSRVSNSILWGNTPDEVLGGTAQIDHSNVQGRYLGVGNISEAPLFLDGNSGNYRLQTGSPCIDSARNSAQEVGTLDRDRNPRLVDEAVDMGAYETQSPDSNPGGLRAPGDFGTIQAALDAASNGDTVLIAPGTYHENDLDFLGKAVTLRCDGTADSCVLDGSGFSRVFNLHSGEGPGTVIRGFTIRNGNAGAAAYGGGIYLYNASPTIEDCVIASNEAIWGGGVSAFQGAQPTLRRCSLILNRATYGGGVYTVDGGAFINCLFSGNVSDGSGHGGAIYAASTPCTITNCTIVGNSTAGNGGGLHDGAGSRVVNSIFWSNTPDELYGVAALVSYSNIQGGYAGIGNTDGDPRFIDPLSTDVMLRDYRLSGGSPCINAGDNNAAGIETTDLNGNARLVGGTVDMGAYEDPCMATWYKDADDDGYSDGATSIACSRPPGYKLFSELASMEPDCNDSDPAVHSTSTWYKDSDADGYSDGTTQVACMRPIGYRPAAELASGGTSGDCNDSSATVYPGASEICDGLDNNCSGAPDEGCLVFTWYRDGDGDGYGDPGDSVQSTFQPSGYVDNNLDTDDSNPAINPATAIPLTERDALIALYNSTNGTGWTNRTNWRLPDDSDFGPVGSECTWFGVTCGNVRVVHLNLSQNALAGPIPAGLGVLSQLQTLYLNNNQLTGSIPTELAGLTRLRTLSLSFNGLTGSIPVQLSALTLLTSLDLGENLLTGAIPAGLGNLGNLTTLNLVNNGLTGSIPTELGNLTTLRSLYLSHNQLTGSIPTTLGSLPLLQNLYLHHNQLSGTIPTQLGGLAGLRNLFLSFNQLTGSIPAELGGLASLTSLDLGENQLSGAIPTELGSLGNLQTLNLLRNGLTDSIPAELGNLSNLLHLYLSHNQLSDPIPASLGGLAQLQNLYLHNNQLSGTIPPQLGSLSSLRTLYLAFNQLTGTIPAALGGLSQLTSLDLGENRLSGAIPAELGNLGNLQTLSLGSNGLSGTIPASLGGLPNLLTLSIRSNRLSGPLPVALKNLNHLQPGGSQFRYNALFTDDPDLSLLLASAQAGGNWQSTQTVAPTGVAIVSSSHDSVTLSWTPILYTGDTGEYQIWSGGILLGATSDKSATGFTVNGLAAENSYAFSIRTVTNSHANNRNIVESGYVPALSVTRYYLDADSDNYGDPNQSILAAAQPAGYVANSLDCDDTDSSIDPGEAELCDGVDNNCDGTVDEGCALLTWYRDSDGDGYGNMAISRLDSQQPAGYVANGMDCDDGNAAITPFTVWYSDGDNDGYSDGATRTQCLRPMGFKLASELTAVSGDCDDANGAYYPGAFEACDGADNNCSGTVDEGCPLLTWYRDDDGDGYGDPGNSVTTPTQPQGYVDNALDSDDDNPGINPNSVWYRDHDGDGYATGPPVTQGTRPSGYFLASELSAITGDCDDADATLHPGASEVCDNRDNNCNGSADEEVSCQILGQSLQVPSDPVTHEPIPVTAGEPLWVTATFRNNTGQPIQTILPDCFNTTFTLLDSLGNVVPPLDRVRTPYSIPEDVVTLPPGEFQVTCNVAELYRYEVLATGDYTVEATYANTVADPDLDASGVCHNPPCVDLWTGAAASPPATIAIASAPPVQTLEAEVSFSPSQWNVQWGQVPGLTITAVLGNITGHGVNEIDMTPGAVRLNGIAATSLVYIAGPPGTLEATFDAYEALRGLGTTFGGSVVYPTVECRLLTTGEVVAAKAPVVLFDQQAPTFYLDADGDGYGDADSSVQAWTAPPDYVVNHQDSDDEDPGVTPTSVWYKDFDGDRHSDGASLAQGSRPSGYFLATELLAISGDCNDLDALIHPGATEVCDGDDNNCNGLNDEGVSCPITGQATLVQVPRDPVTQNPLPVRAGEPLWVTATFRNDSGQPIQTILPDCFNTNFTLTDARGNVVPPLDRVRAPYSIPEDVVTLPPGEFLVSCNAAEMYRHEALEAGSYTVEATYTSTIADPDLRPDGTCANQPCVDLWTGSAGSPPASITVALLPATQTYSAEVSFSPPQWNVQWGKVPGQTITAVLGNVTDHGVSEIDPNPATVRLNGQGATTVAIDPALGTLTAVFDAFEAVRGLGTTFGGSVVYSSLECRLAATGDVVLAKGPVALIDLQAPTFYRDADGDGYGDADATVQAWSLPPDYVENNQDSDDGNPSVNPTTVWYRDADADGYSDGATLTRGTQPDGYVLPGGLIATAGDCDDSDGRIHPATVWHKDADRDGYPNGNTLTQCARPEGHRLLDELVSMTVDCNDDDATVYPGAAEACDGKDNDCNGAPDDVAGNLCNLFQETLTVPVAAVRPGEPLWVTATFINHSGQPIKTIRPDCYNTTFTVQDASGAILAPLDRVRIPYEIPGDIVTIAPGSFSVTCDLAEMYRPEILSSAQGGASVTYTVQAAYTNFVRDPDIDASGHCTRPDGLCYPLWEGAVGSTSTSFVTLAGAVLERAASEVTFDPPFWPAEWASSTGRTIKAAITNADGVDAASIRLNGSVEIIAGTDSRSNGTLTVMFDAARAVKTLGPPWPPALGVVYPMVEGRGLTELVSGKQAVRLTLAGDLDGDGDIDSNDVNILLKYRNKPASAYPECDLDKDGVITVLDARKLVLKCTRTNCATR
ncbi:MAG: MopE-related protein [Syntrophobacteraceae bacterium]